MKSENAELSGQEAELTLAFAFYQHRGAWDISSEGGRDVEPKFLGGDRNNNDNNSNSSTKALNAKRILVVTLVIV